MTGLLAAMLLIGFSPADSAMTLISIREVPLRALLFMEQASRLEGSSVVELGWLLELAGRFQEAERVYALASRNADPNSRAWLNDRLRGVALLDTTIVLRAVLSNIGSETVRNVVLMVPKPLSHPPYQQLSVYPGDFSGGGPVLTLAVDSLQPGERVERTIRIRLIQRPHTFRPIDGFLDDGILADLVRWAREARGTRSDPGPCLEMSRDLVERASGMGIPMRLTGGLMQRGDSLVFHAWAVLDTIVPGLPIDPLLMRTDSMMAVGHCPTDMIPLWRLEYTDGCELSALYSGRNSILEMNMRAYYSER